jgi:hypothetical protein
MSKMVKDKIINAFVIETVPLSGEFPLQVDAVKLGFSIDYEVPTGFKEILLADDRRVFHYEETDILKIVRDVTIPEDKVFFLPKGDGMRITTDDIERHTIRNVVKAESVDVKTGNKSFRYMSLEDFNECYEGFSDMSFEHNDQTVLHRAVPRNLSIYTLGSINVMPFTERRKYK